MPLIDQVQQEMVAAMKSGDAARLSALRMLKAALMKQKVDSQAARRSRRNGGAEDPHQTAD
jgi:uncharacterized protein YqeY